MNQPTTGEYAGNTGLPVYPGARLSRDSNDGDSERATVSIATPWVGVHANAAEYEGADSPERILAFYRRADEVIRRRHRMPWRGDLHEPASCKARRKSIGAPPAASEEAQP